MKKRKENLERRRKKNWNLKEILELTLNQYKKNPVRHDDDFYWWDDIQYLKKHITEIILMDKEKYNMKDENGNWCSKKRVLEYIEYLVGFEIRCDYSFSSELLNRYNNELQNLLEKYQDLNDNGKLMNEYEDEMIEESLWEFFDCGLGHSELIGECVSMRRDIDKLKKSIKKLELC